MMRIPIGITARNEAANIRALMNSLRQSAAHATAALGVEYELHVLLNDNRDQHAQLLAAETDLQIWQTSGGIVEAQRALASARPGVPFLIFTDADILIHPHHRRINRGSEWQPGGRNRLRRKVPDRTPAHTPLARALFLYNLREGYQTRRNYCNGQCFAIRHWHIPTPAELTWDPAADNSFLHLSAGIRTDDIYLSRDLLRRLGPQAFRCTPSGIQYRPPETLEGMFRQVSADAPGN